MEDEMKAYQERHEKNESENNRINGYLQQMQQYKIELEKLVKD